MSTRLPAAARKQRQVWLIPLAVETRGVLVKLCYTLIMRAIPERLRDASCGGTIQIDYLYLYSVWWGNQGNPLKNAQELISLC